MSKQRPVFLDIQQIQFPATAIASILHRISGVIFFVGLAILLYLLGISLSSESGFEQATQILSGGFAKLIIWGLITAISFHVIGGIRHLVMDLGHWEEMDSGNLSANICFGLSLLVALIAGIWLW